MSIGRNVDIDKKFNSRVRPSFARFHIFIGGQAATLEVMRQNVRDKIEYVSLVLGETSRWFDAREERPGFICSNWICGEQSSLQEFRNRAYPSARISIYRLPE